MQSIMERRTFLAALGAPAIVTAATEKRGYRASEIEKMIERGTVKGRLTRGDLPTPALLLELDAFERNVAKMASHCKQHGRALRPHGKTHKCPEIAKALIRAGAVGACAAKLSEAEAFARGGVTGLLVTTEVIGKHKIERAVRLAHLRPETIFCVDNAQNAQDLNDAAKAGKAKLNVAVDLHFGRTGILPGEPALALAKHVTGLANLKLAGIQAYHGGASHTVGWEARRKTSQEKMAEAVETRRMLEKAGIPCPLLTGGSTGTYNIDSEIEGITELQPGSFMFMDLDYNRIGGKDGSAVFQDFENSLTVLTTVVSKPTDAKAIVDGGYKAFSTDKPYMPKAKGIENLPYSFAGDEHGSLNLAQAAGAVNVGDRLEFVVPHCDPSVNLYDRIYCLRGDQVEAAWRIAARGMSQ